MPRAWMRRHPGERPGAKGVWQRGGLAPRPGLGSDLWGTGTPLVAEVWRGGQVPASGPAPPAWPRLGPRLARQRARSSWRRCLDVSKPRDSNTMVTLGTLQLPLLPGE